METILIILIILMYIIIFIRINLVYEFRLEILNLPDFKYKDYYYKLPSYSKMLYSFKRLRLKDWYNEEDTKKIEELLKQK